MKQTITKQKETVIKHLMGQRVTVNGEYGWTGTLEHFTGTYITLKDLDVRWNGEKKYREMIHMRWIEKLEPAKSKQD
jgi:hypothetical protein